MINLESYEGWKSLNEEGTVSPLGGLPSGMVKVTDANLETVKKTPGKLVVIDFWADWCTPCMKLGKVLEELSKDVRFKKMLVGKYEFSFELPIAKKLAIKTIPVLMIYKNGVLVKKITGYKDTDKQTLTTTLLNLLPK